MAHGGIYTTHFAGWNPVRQKPTYLNGKILCIRRWKRSNPLNRVRSGSQPTRGRIGKTEIPEGEIGLQMRRYHLYNNLERRKDISVPIYDCVMRHWKRGDVAQLLAQKRGSSVREVKRIVASGDTHLLFSAVDAVVDDVFDHVKRQDLSDLPPIIYREKVDPSSGKVRNIGVESIVQQLYDEVADYAIQPLKRRIGTYQIACLKGKGGALGIRAMKRWMRDKRVRWACQCDIKKCYESTDRVKMMAFLRHIIRGSPRVLWLIETLINTHRQGLNIGCKLSQDLMNIYLSVLYHDMMERTMVVRKRRGKEKSIQLLFTHSSRWTTLCYCVQAGKMQKIGRAHV